VKLDAFLKMDGCGGVGASTAKRCYENKLIYPPFFFSLLHCWLDMLCSTILHNIKCVLHIYMYL
jgi:hypothetical protein